MGLIETLVSLSPIEGLCPIVGSHKTEGKVLEGLGRTHSQAFGARETKGVLSPFADVRFKVYVKELQGKSQAG